MKILNLKEFRALPSGTVFMKYVPAAFGPLLIKGETIECDFFYTNVTCEADADNSSIMMDMLDKAEADSDYSVPMNFEVEGRDGLYEKEQLFAVYEQDDLYGLLNALQVCKGI